MVNQVRSIWQRRNLLYYLVKFQMKAENKNKVLGFLWSLLDPLLLLGIYIVLVHFIFKAGGEKFPILLFTALIAWIWFASSLNKAVTSITSKVKLIQTVRFPLAILPLSGVIVGMVDWLFGLVILVPMLFIYHVQLSVYVLWLPVLLLVQFVGTVGVCLICAVIGTYLSDLTNVVQFAIRLLMYLSPILYSVEDRIPERVAKLYMIGNPFAGLFESYKNILIRGQAPSEYVMSSVVVSIVVLVIGLWYFNREEYKLVKAI